MIDTYSGAGHFADDANYEVQRSNHFEIVINLEALNLGGGNDYQEAVRLCCTKASIPDITIQTTGLKHGNETVHVAQAPEFGEGNISVYDTIGKSMAMKLQDWFHRIFDPTTHTMGLVTSYKTTASLFLFSPNAQVIRSWTLYGVFPKSLRFGELSAENAQVMSIDMNLSVDKTILDIIKE